MEAPGSMKKTATGLPFYCCILAIKVIHNLIFKKLPLCPDQCGSVGWALSRKVKGRQFDPWSGHVPSLWV